MLGGGHVGVEFASMHAAFGAKVTLIQRGEQLLPGEDPDIAAEVRALLTDAGVRVVTGATVERVEDAGAGGAVVTYRTGSGHTAITYVSLDDYRIVLDQLTGSGTRSVSDRRYVPHVVFTTPPPARVGMTEAEARATGRPLRIAVRRVAEMAAVPRAKIVGDG
ncbi:Putative Dihydrolipoamide dehydrogenase; Mercuric ion reductase; PF00070 family, FAD-dependent NAD(P)-disulphide oxidoreductase [[Actinomadura] parvosata subsp. kistnae]|nr:Putative Dihydrolipoamide dehydrogenase; Mercuric ion reductase; PF00070 family, FAD-dependent NAD(P)-disulphide oxidoreductase [Actinomadura parvosata subsp. kistnae]